MSTFYTYMFSFMLTFSAVYVLRDGKSAAQIKRQGDLYKFMEDIGYPLEAHYITTKDNYILTAFRISKSHASRSEKKNRPVVIVSHGLMVSASGFLLMGPKKSLALKLFDLGYEVWMSNARGTQWSRNHTYLNPDKDLDFWKFSIDDIALMDLPATIDYILNVTSQSQLTIIGHSQGGASPYALTATDPSYNEKINLIIALAPSVFVQDGSSPAGALFSIDSVDKMLKMSLEFHNTYELFPFNEYITQFGQFGCTNSSMFQIVCVKIFEFAAGGLYNIHRDMIPHILLYEPSGSSYLQVRQFTQWIKTGLFRKYDWGAEENKIRYGQITPPHYNLTNSVVPTAIFYSDDDVMVRKTDVEKLIRKLPNVVQAHLIADKHFQHLDFMWADNINELVNNDVIETLQQYII